MKTMKTTEVYNVSVTLNDGNTLVCTLLNKPDASTLIAVAAAQNVAPDFGKVLALAGDIEIPAAGNNIKTAISVVDVLIGTVCVETRTAYGVPTKHPRQPKTDAPATPAVKRGRKPRAVAAATPETPPDALAVSADAS